MFSHESAYDTNTHVFSPQGGLLQIEYAHSATQKGSLAIGIKTDNAAVLVTERARKSSLLVSKCLDKIQFLDDHVLCVYSGIVSDANILVDRARVELENHKFTFDEPMSIRSLVQTVGRTANNYSDPDLAEDDRMYARPFGVSFLFAGFDGEDDGPDTAVTITRAQPQEGRTYGGTSRKMRLYLLSPSGTEDSVDAIAVGAGAESAVKEINANYRSDLSVDEATALALRVMKNVSADQVQPENVEIAVITTDEGALVYTDKRIQEAIKKAANIG